MAIIPQSDLPMRARGTISPCRHLPANEPNPREASYCHLQLARSPPQHTSRSSPNSVRQQQYPGPRMLRLARSTQYPKADPRPVSSCRYPAPASTSRAPARARVRGPVHTLVAPALEATAALSALALAVWSRAALRSQHVQPEQQHLQSRLQSGASGRAGGDSDGRVRGTTQRPPAPPQQNPACSLMLLGVAVGLALTPGRDRQTSRTCCCRRPRATSNVSSSAHSSPHNAVARTRCPGASAAEDADADADAGVVPGAVSGVGALQPSASPSVVLPAPQPPHGRRSSTQQLQPGAHPGPWPSHPSSSSSRAFSVRAAVPSTSGAL